jgi:predicted PurR-regulated permease PerM
MNDKIKDYIKLTTVVTLTVLGIIAFVLILLKIRAVIPPILYAIFIAYLLLPITNFFAKKMPRFLASFFSILIFVVIFALLGYLIFPQITKQFTEFVQKVPNIANTIKDYLNNLIKIMPVENKPTGVDTFIQNLSANIELVLTNMLKQGTTIVLRKVSLIPSVFLSLVLAFFFMKDSTLFYRITRKLHTENDTKKWEIFLEKTNREVRDYYSLLLLVAIFTGFTMGLMSYLVGVPYYLLIGAMDSVLELLPYIGPTIVFTIGGLFAIFKSLNTFLLFALLFFAIEAIQSQIVIPHFAGRKINLPPVAVILLIILGGAIGGILGIIIAVPTFIITKNLLLVFYPDIYRHFINNKTKQ